MLDLSSYDRIVVFFSGGKDSLACLPEPFGKPLALAMGMDRKPLVLKRDVVASQLQSSEVSLYF